MHRRIYSLLRHGLTSTAPHFKPAATVAPVAPVAAVAAITRSRSRSSSTCSARTRLFSAKVFQATLYSPSSELATCTCASHYFDF